MFVGCPTNTRYQTNVCSMLVHHLRRWPNITPTQGECLVFAGQVVSGDDSVTETQSGVNDLSTWLSYCGQSVRPHSDCHAHTYTQYLWSSTITLLLWSLHSSSSIQLSATGRLLDITHMCYEYTIPLLPGQLRQPRQVDLSVNFHTSDSKEV